MSATGGMTAGRPNGYRQFTANVSATLATLLRKPRTSGSKSRVWHPWHRIIAIVLIAVVLIVAAMAFLDDRMARAARELPPNLVVLFDEITDFGKSGWFLIPAGILLLAIAFVATWKLPAMTRLVLAALTVRLGFLFLAIGLPSLFVTIMKRLIGRARPFVVDDGGVLIFMPFAWRAEYASIPSGHGTTAFAAAIAIGALWPRARFIVWIYALLIAASRVIITAHYPSDVIASAVFGILGALLVRDWFAARRLGFVIDAEGHMRAMPGPTWRRIKAVAGRLRNA